MNQQSEKRDFNWVPTIVACGALACALSGYGLFALISALRASSAGDANGMLRFFICVILPPFFASFRLLFRRKWSGIVVALFGWFAVYDWLSGPNTFGRFDWLTGLTAVATLILTVALLNGEKSWKRGF